MVKKLLLSVVLIILAVLLFINYQSINGPIVCFLLVLVILIDGIVSRKKKKRVFKPNPTELDDLENSVLVVQDYKSLFVKISKFFKFFNQFFSFRCGKEKNMI